MSRESTVPPYLLSLPAARRSGVVFASPHSGRDYSEAFLRRAQLDARTMRSSEDAFVDRLLAPAPELGAPLLAATAPRAYVDLNRAEDELDPALVEGVSLRIHNPRVASGLGVIPRVVAGGRVIRSGKITRAEAEARIARHWRPYHAALDRLMTAAEREFGAALLIDVHSMPHEATESAGGWRRRPQVVLGDRFGSTAASEVTERIGAAFEAEGLSVARNTPFAGAYIVQTYGRPALRRHAVQVEIDRALYMDERTVTPHEGFAEFAALMRRVIATLIRSAAGGSVLPLAAE